MLNITTTIAEAVGTKLAATYRHYYGDQEPRFATILDAGARLIIERISTSDASPSRQARSLRNGRPISLRIGWTPFCLG
jgi:hypothetical protein